MPARKNDKPPPEVMTWTRASPVLAVCVVFDALRLFFEWFVFFGPALAAVYCVQKVGGAVGETVGGLLCGGVIGTAAYFGSGAIEVFGIVMAMAVGLLGWLIVLLMNILNNANIFKENFAMLLKYGVGLLISETPILGSLPALTVVNAIMFRVQIQKGKEHLKKYGEENAAAQLQERRERAVELMRARTVQIAEMETVQDAEHAEAMNNEEIPERVRRAA